MCRRGREHLNTLLLLLLSVSGMKGEHSGGATQKAFLHQRSLHSSSVSIVALLRLKNKKSKLASNNLRDKWVLKLTAYS